MNRVTHPSYEPHLTLLNFNDSSQLSNAQYHVFFHQSKQRCSLPKANATAILILTLLLLLIVGIMQMTSIDIQVSGCVPSLNLDSKASNGTSAVSTTTLKPMACPKPSFSKEKLPITALASFPGCGNTWARHLIQAMTGILTGAVYNDEKLRRHGFPGEGKSDGSVIAIKTHLETNAKFERCVLLMRNPYSAFMAEFNRQNSNSHTGSVKIDKFIKSWDRFFGNILPTYPRFYLKWFKHKNVHLVLYDNLVEDLGSELSRLLKYLRNSTSVVGNVQCALRNATGEHKRDHSKSPPLEFFYSKDKIIKVNRMINDLITTFSKRFPQQVDVMKQWKLPETGSK